MKLNIIIFNTYYGFKKLLVSSDLDQLSYLKIVCNGLLISSPVSCKFYTIFV